MSTDVLVPTLPESVADATIVDWHKKPGDFVKQGETLVDLETDKVVLEVPAPVDGILGEILVQTGEVVTAENVLAKMEAGEAPSETKVAEETAAPTQIEEANDGNGVLTPAVRRMVKENKLDASKITGTGKDGRVLKADVLSYMETQSKAGAAKEEQLQPLPSLTQGARPEQRVAMTRLRSRVAERLVQAQQTAAILTTFNEVDLQAVIDIRRRHQEAFEKRHEVRVGFMPFFVKAAVEALKRFPIVNASVDGEDIIYHGFYDVGIAVGSPRGLVVPILRDCDQLGFADIEKGIREYGQKAQDGSLSFDDLTGGTFTISNGGVYGSMLSTPILNPPQSAILGMHNIQQRPMAVNGEVVIRPMMYLALSYDHRIVDGRDAVQFLVTIKELLEDPARLLLDI